MFKRRVFAIVESWNNGCDNARDERFSVHSTLAQAKARLQELISRMTVKGGLGPEFTPDAEYAGYGYADDPAWFADERNFSIWYPDDGDTGRKSDDGAMWDSLLRRQFRIIRTEIPEWAFLSEEEDGLTGEFRGVLTDGFHFLFWKTDPAGKTCRIYNSITFSEDTLEVEYPWSAENDSLVVNALTMMRDGDTIAGEDSVLLDIVFLPGEESAAL